MIIMSKKGKTRESNIQCIIIKDNDKYGIAMIAYFKNLLNGQNVKGLTIKNKEQVQLYHNRINKIYILQILKFSIAEKCILSQYKNFKKNYNILIKDKICHI